MSIFLLQPAEMEFFSDPLYNGNPAVSQHSNKAAFFVCGFFIFFDDVTL